MGPPFIRQNASSGVETATEKWGGGGLKSFHWLVCQLTGKQSSLPIGHDARHKRPAAVNFSTGVVKGTCMS